MHLNDFEFIYCFFLLLLLLCRKLSIEKKLHTFWGKFILPKIGMVSRKWHFPCLLPTAALEVTLSVRLSVRLRTDRWTDNSDNSDSSDSSDSNGKKFTQNFFKPKQKRIQFKKNYKTIFFLTIFSFFLPKKNFFHQKNS